MAGAAGDRRKKTSNRADDDKEQLENSSSVPSPVPYHSQTHNEGGDDTTTGSKEVGGVATAPEASQDSLQIAVSEAVAEAIGAAGDGGTSATTTAVSKETPHKLNSPEGEEDVESRSANNNKRKSGEEEEEAPVDAGDDADYDGTNNSFPKKKRLCRYPGCTKVIKSQGHCQRHGAKAKRCKVEGCDKQAQGTHDGMCKRHWKAVHFPESSRKNNTPPEPEGESVYDSILPMSIAYRPMQHTKIGGAEAAEEAAAAASADSKHDLLDPPTAPEGFQAMPLVSFFKEGTLAGKPAGWHRNQERRARGLYPVKGLSVQLEPWERQLALIEIMLLSGGTPYANFRELAHAWGREKGFHHVLANSVCERRGEVERKKRSDCGKLLTEEEKESFKKKLKETRDKNGTSRKGASSSEDDERDSTREKESDTEAGAGKGETMINSEKATRVLENATTAIQGEPGQILGV